MLLYFVIAFITLYIVVLSSASHCYFIFPFEIQVNSIHFKKLIVFEVSLLLLLNFDNDPQLQEMICIILDNFLVFSYQNILLGLIKITSMRQIQGVPTIYVFMDKEENYFYCQVLEWVGAVDMQYYH